MPFNGSGTFAYTTVGTPVVTNTTMSSTMFNAVLTEGATGLSLCIAKDGQSATTARIPFAQGISSTLSTDATSASTGSIITAGGISAVKSIWAGTSLMAGNGTLYLGIGQGVNDAILFLGSTFRVDFLKGNNSGDANIACANVFLGTSPTSSTLLLKRSTTTLQIRLGDDSAYATIDALAYKVGGVAGIDFGPAHPASITVVKGVVTACS